MKRKLKAHLAPASPNEDVFAKSRTDAGDARSKLDIRRAMETFRPKAIYHYFDRIRIHVKSLRGFKLLKALRKECTKVVELGPLRFNPLYQKLEIYQPNAAALRLLADLPAYAYVAYVEVACDVIAPDESSLDIISTAFQHGFLQPHHRNKKARTFVEVQGYVKGFTSRQTPEKGERRSGYWLQWYRDRPCKITGEPNCFHFEGKHEGAQAVKRLGIRHPSDLSGFDFNEYFSKRVSKLYVVNYDRLGRFDDNRRSGSKRKKSYVGEWGSDRRTGHRIYRALSQDEAGGSLQTFVDRYGTGPFLEPYTISMFIGTNHLTSHFGFFDFMPSTRAEQIDEGIR
jgi:hypothetical protein